MREHWNAPLPPVCKRWKIISIRFLSACHCPVPKRCHTIKSPLFFPSCPNAARLRDVKSVSVCLMVGDGGFLHVRRIIASLSARPRKLFTFDEVRPLRLFNVLPSIRHQLCVCVCGHTVRNIIFVQKCAKVASFLKLCVCRWITRGSLGPIIQLHVSIKTQICMSNLWNM